MKTPAPRPNRRDLFRKRATPRPALVDPTSTPAESYAAGDLLRASRPAMGSYFEVRLAAATPGALGLAERALDLIDELESQLTVYRDDSEVSRLNTEAFEGPVVVEAGLFSLLERAVELGKATGGAYDVTTGALSDAWGFTRGPRRVPDAETLLTARSRTGSDHLILNAENRTVSFARPGMKINLGSIGKGYAIDRAAAVFRDYWWPTSALVHGGRSSLYALGSPPGTLGGRWEIGLRNPFDAESPLGMVRLRNRGMGTSGASFQNFEVEGRVYGHILDPRTGEPAIGPASVTVLAPTAAEADALSTAFYLLDRDEVARFVKARPGVGAIVVDDPRGQGRPRVTTFGIGPEDFDPWVDGRPRSRPVAYAAAGNT